MGRELEKWQNERLGHLRRSAEAIRAVQAAVEPQMVADVYALRFPGGGDVSWSEPPVAWEEIGEALGTSGEAARQRFGPRVKEWYLQAVRDWAVASFDASDEQIDGILAHEREADV